MQRSEKLFFAAIAVIYLTLFFSFRFTNDPVSGWKGIIASDGKGYYSYLVHAFIEHDMTYHADEHLYAAPNEKNQYVNRFYGGTAVLELPFFALGYVAAWILGYPLDGYSQPFAFFIGLSSLFYAFMGLVILYRLLKKFIGCSTNTAMWVTALAFAGTNLIFYAVIYGSFSHTFSFFSITLFMYQLYRLRDKPSHLQFALTALLAGLIIIIRPVNALTLLFVPAVFTNAAAFVLFLKTHVNYRWIFYVCLFIIPLLLQCLLWYAQTGNLLEWPYIQEGFYFSRPQISEVLVGFRRGAFIYCPLLLLSLLGVYYGIRTKPWTTLWLVIFLMIFIYVTASWWHWTYGDTFGMRPFNDVLVVFMVLLAVLLKEIRKIRNVVLTFCVFFTGLNLMYAYQFSLGITHISTMNRQKFADLFMDFSLEENEIYGGQNDIPPYAPNGFKIIHHSFFNYSHLPGGVLHITNEEWPGESEFIYPHLHPAIRHVWLQVSYKQKIKTSAAMKDLLFVVHTRSGKNDSTLLYYTFHVKEFPQEKTGKWKTVNHSVWLPDSFNSNEKVGLYFWNRGKEEFLMDDLKITLKIPRF